VGGRSPCCDEALAHGNGIWMIIALSAQDLKFADGVVLQVGAERHFSRSFPVLGFVPIALFLYVGLHPSAAEC
jgi:hypothetical protein